MLHVNVKTIYVWIFALTLGSVISVLIVLNFGSLNIHILTQSNPNAITNGLFKQTQQKYPKGTNVTSKKCGYTILRNDRYGSKIHDMIFAWSWAIQNNVTYVGAVGSSEHTDTLLQLIGLLNLSFSIQRDAFKNCVLLSTEYYKKDHWIQINPLFNRFTVKNNQTNRRIVVHIRRGDVTMESRQAFDYYRYIPDSYFLNIIYRIRKPRDHVIIFSEGRSLKSFGDYVREGYDVRLDMSEVQMWRAILESDIFIMSRSSFSFVPALFTKGDVFYTEFWYRPLRHWNINSNFLSSINRETKISMNESVLPCDGGEFGANNVQTYACVLSKDKTITSYHIFNLARTIYPCWSWFAEKGARNCAFFVTYNLTHKWFDFITSKMGCLVLHRKPVKCTVLGILNRRSVREDQSNSWLSNIVDASNLQNITFRRITGNKGLGIINRRHRGIINIDKMKLTPDIVYFEDISYQKQAEWMNEHDIIIAAYGVELTNVIFIKKCTVVILLYPDHYYRHKLYESLIKESGGIPISWVQNKDLVSTISLEKDVIFMKNFKEEFGKHHYWRAQDIDINASSMAYLLQTSREQQQTCRNNK